jgi:outer membrane protein
MIKFNNITLIFFLLVPSLLMAQVGMKLEGSLKNNTSVSDSADILSLEEAMRQGLENNHNIIVRQRQQEQANNNVFIGNAGFLPRLNLTGNYQHSIQNTYLEFAGEMPPIDRNNAASTTYGTSVELQYTLFDGLSRFYQYDRLQELGRTADIQTQLTIENTLFSIVQTYLEVARQLENYNISQTAVELSAQRLERVQNTYDYGGNSKLDVLNAKVDLNTDSVNLTQASLNLENTKRNLNVLMGRDPSHEFVVRDDFEINNDLELDQLLDKAMKQNASLQLARYNLNTARLDEKISGANNLPRLNLNGSYGYNRQENEASFIESQEQLGFTGGLSLNYTIYDANVRSTQIQNAEISSEIEQENVTLTKKQLQRDVLNAYATFDNNLFLLEKEQDNLETARLNFERSESALRLGQINSTQFREAQLNLIRAQRSINNLYYQAKLSEVRLYRLAGVLSQ